jgi:diguanylate cyclase (GGDEF)-like protein
LVHNYETEVDDKEMTTILWDDRGEFAESGETFPIPQFMPGLDEVMKKGSGIDTMVVRLLNSGQKVYGYIVEGMKELDDRRLQRCNEFAMFLTHSIDTVLHNYQMKKLNDNLSRAYNKISTLYILDPMTRIYNRRGFSQKMDELLEQRENIGKYLYLFSIDMDGLKYINDNFGHGEGDFAITAVAKAVSKCCGQGAVCSRFGGDEFTCAILEKEPEVHSVGSFSERLKETLAAMGGVSSKPYPISVSVGMVSQRVSEEMNIETMLQQADHLMYKDKVARKKQRT